MIYVGSAESEECDQVFNVIYVEPVPEGRHVCVFKADPPDVTKIPEPDAVGVNIVLLTGQEFVRVGYFVNNDYAYPAMRENPPPRPLFDKLTRNILVTKPRVTRFKINWDDAPSNELANGNGEHIVEEMQCGSGGINGGASTSTNATATTNHTSLEPPEATTVAIPIENGMAALNENSFVSYGMLGLINF